MRYIVTNRFKGQAICGAVNLPYGTACETQDGYLVLEGGRRLCAVTSQNAYDFFSRNDDGHGLERGKLVEEITSRMEKRDAKHQTRWDKLWADEVANRLRRKDSPDFWIWSFDFYNADIPDLKHISNLIGIKN